MYLIELNRTGGQKVWLLPSEEWKGAELWTDIKDKAKRFNDWDHADRCVKSLKISPRSMELVQIVGEDD